jgi:hypothetical protein
VSEWGRGGTGVGKVNGGVPRECGVEEVFATDDTKESGRSEGETKEDFWASTAEVNATNCCTDTQLAAT